MIQVGDQIPDVEVTMLGPDGSPMGVRTGSLLGSGRNILFATPVPFSRGCSNVHLPGYVENAQKLAALLENGSPILGNINASITLIEFV